MENRVLWVSQSDLILYNTRNVLFIYFEVCFFVKPLLNYCKGTDERKVFLTEKTLESALNSHKWNSQDGIVRC